MDNAKYKCYYCNYTPKRQDLFISCIERHSKRMHKGKSIMWCDRDGKMMGGIQDSPGNMIKSLFPEWFEHGS